MYANHTYASNEIGHWGLRLKAMEPAVGNYALSGSDQDSRDLFAARFLLFFLVLVLGLTTGA